MLTSFIRLCLLHKPLVLISTAGLVAWGIFSFSRLPIDAIPDITNNQVQILTVCPDLTTLEVERLVTHPVEQAVRNSPGVLELRSISRFGLSVITVVFEESMPNSLARQVISERLTAIWEDIPAAAGRPEMAPISTGLGEILHYRIEALPGFHDRYSPTDLRTIQDWTVKRQLAGIPGVVEINSFGGNQKEYEIAVDPAALRARNVSLEELVEAVQASNRNAGGAYIEKGPDLYFVRALGMLSQPADIERIVVAMKDGVPVHVGDVAVVRSGSALRFGAVTSGGQDEIVLGIVMMLKDANAAEVIRAVKERMATVQEALPEGVVITPFLDREALVDRTMATVRNNLIEGALIVILVLLLLVGNLRASLVIASVIPLSMLFAVGMMVAFGISANLMSLGSLDFGLVIDAAIILVEATLFYLVLKKEAGQQVGPMTRADMEEGIVTASSKVVRSSVFGVLIIVLVYLPVYALTGIEGKMFKPMALTVSFALIGALVLSLTYVPVMASLFLNRRDLSENRVTRWTMHTLESMFRPALSAAIRMPAAAIVLAAGMFLISLGLFRTLGGEFVPELDEGDILMHGFCKPGTSLSQTIESHYLAQRLILEQFPDEVDQVISKIGTAEIPTDPMAIETADNLILLHPRHQWTKARSKQDLVEQISQTVRQVPGMAYEFTQPIQMRFDEMMTGVRSDIAVKIFGENLDTLAWYADRVAKRMAHVPGAVDVKVEQVLGLPVRQAVLDYERMARYGIPAEKATEAVRIAYAGLQAGYVYEEEKRFRLVVRLDRDERENPEVISRLPVRTAGGQLVPLEQVARIGYSTEAAQISRENGQRRIVISANVRGVDVEKVIGLLEEDLKRELRLPPGYTLSYGGQFEHLRAAKSRLAIAVPVALMLIAILLYMAFGNLRHTALILSAVPLSAIGGILALWIRDMPFSISAGIGFIVLFGIAVLNGIVLITYLNQLEKEENLGARDRVFKAAMLRLRPVLMTAAAGAMGFLPMAISDTAGAEVQRPLATVVIGGLITSTLLTLLVLPALYLLVEKIRPGWTRPTVAVLLLLAGSGSLGAQDVPMTEQEAMQRVRGKHPAVLAEMLSGQQAEARIRHPLPWQPARLHHGINADPGDGVFGTTVLGLEMALPSSARIRAARKEQESRLESARASVLLAEAEAIRQLRMLYAGFRYNRDLAAHYALLDSLYTEMARIAGTRVAGGASPPLESRLLRTESARLRMTRESLQQAYTSMCAQLGAWTGQGDPVTPALLAHEDPAVQGIPDKPPVTLWEGLLNARVRQAQVNVEAHDAQFRPEWDLDVFGQLVPDGTIYPGYTIGLSVPLFRKSYLAARESARIGVLQAEAGRNRDLLERQQRILETENDIRILEDQLSFYRAEALPASDEIIRVATAMYQSGAVDWFAWNQAASRALEHRLAYIETVHAYRQSLLQLQFLQQ